jgi:hypothetical protein
MQQNLNITRTSRKILAQILKGYTLDQLNKIPEGYNNNLIWNIAHVIVVQQMLVYKLSGLPMKISDEMVEKYKKGTKPEHIATQAEVDKIQIALEETINQTEIDLENKIFINFQEYPTSAGIVLKSAAEAMAFNDFHEGLHIGIIMSIRKFV